MGPCLGSSTASFSTSLGVLASVLAVLGLEEDLDLLAKDDELGQRLQDVRLRRPRRSPKGR